MKWYRTFITTSPREITVSSLPIRPAGTASPEHLHFKKMCGFVCATPSAPEAEKLSSRSRLQ